MDRKEFNYLEEQKYIRAKKKVKSIKGFYVHFTVYVLVNLFLILVQVYGNGWVVLMEWETFGTALFWGIGLGFHAFGVFGMDILLGKTWENKKIKEIMDKDKKEFWE